jgi:hypothetical protein
MELHGVEIIPLKDSTLQHLLRQAEYRVTVETDLPAEVLAERIEGLLSAETIAQTRQRKNQTEAIDLRPWLHDLAVESLSGGEATLRMRLTAGQFGNLRPEELLKALGLGDNWAEIERIRLIFE